MRVIFQTTASVLVATAAFLVSPMFFPFILIGAYCAIFGPVAVIAALQRPAASRSPNEAITQERVAADGQRRTPPRAASRLPAQA